MKTLLFLTLMSISFIGFNQQTPSKLPRKTNTIILKMPGDAKEVLTNYAYHLQDKGFAIEKLDKELLSLTTEPKPINGSDSMKIYVFARENNNTISLIIKGNVYSILNFSAEACICGIVGDIRRAGFKEMLESIEGFSYDTIEFEIR